MIIEVDPFIQNDLIQVLKKVHLSQFYIVEQDLSIAKTYAIKQEDIVESADDIIKLFTSYINENYDKRPL